VGLGWASHPSPSSVPNSAHLTRSRERERERERGVIFLAQPALCTKPTRQPEGSVYTSETSAKQDQRREADWSEEEIMVV